MQQPHRTFLLCKRSDAVTVLLKVCRLQVNLNPTHVVMNFGNWFMKETEAIKFPSLPAVCEFLNGDHAFKVVWQTTTPQWYLNSTAADHHVHIPEACSLPDSMVLHRGPIAFALAQDLYKWQDLFHDMKHFSPPAYHAFNGALLDMITHGGNETRVQKADAPQSYTIGSRQGASAGRY